jgi:hypothetical protein
MLTGLGIARWDTFPPQSGEIKWYGADDEVVAQGKYQVILSWGPGVQYTMGWNVGAYPSMGIPYVAKEIAGEPGTVTQGERTAEDVQAEAYARADEVAARMGADFAYQASTLLIAVSDFRTTEARAAAKPAAKPAKPAAKAAAAAKKKAAPTKAKAKAKALPAKAKAKTKTPTKTQTKTKTKPKKKTR